MIHAATIEKTNRTKGVHNYVYAYVFIWLNQLCNSSLSLIPVLRHGNVQRRPLQPAQEKGMEKCPASLWRNIPVLLSGLPPLMERGVSNGTLKGAVSYQVEPGADARGNLTRIDNALDKMPENLETCKIKLSNLLQQQEAAKAEIGKPFPQEEELQRKSARLAELDAELNIGGKQPETA